jgi:hypothetical protein
MKRLFIALSVLFIVLSAQAQVIIKNPKSVPMEVRANRGSTIINAGQSVRVNFVHPNEKGVKFSCFYYEKGKLNSFNVATDIVGDNITLSSSTPSVISTNNKKAKRTSSDEAIQSMDEFVSPNSSVLSSMPSQAVKVINKSSKKWIVDADSGPFMGIALAPGDTSSTVNLTPDLYQFTVVVDQDQEASATGRNFTQAVIKFILVSGATEVIITDENVVPIGGSIAKVILASTFSEKIVFVGSSMYGRAMKGSSRLKGKVNLTIGFNSLSVQFYYKGSRYQADLEFILAEGEYVATIGKENFRNIIKID